MDTLELYGTLLAAEDDVLTYLLLPWGEEGRTSLGKVTASRGALTIPDDLEGMFGNLEHSPRLKASRPVRIEETDAGLVASVRPDDTPLGRALAAEIAAGERSGISVEVERPVIRGGRLIAGALSGYGHTEAPAFPSAVLVASDAGELPDGMADQDSTTETTETIVVDGVEYVRKTTSTYTTETTRADGEGDDPQEDPAVDTTTTTPATAPAGGLAASRAATARKPEKAGPKTLEEAAALLASAFRSGGHQALTAALVDITHDDGDNDGDGLGEITANVEWLGEVFNEAPYERLYIPLIQSGTLTSYAARGYRFATLPVVAKYAGNKAAVPSTGITAEPVSYGMQRWANAADIDRRYVDFSDSEVIAAFIRANVESYKEVTDVETLLDIIAAGDAVTPGTVPTDVDPAVAAIADGALALLADGLRPTGAIVGSDLYRGMLLTPKDKITEFLAESFGLEGGSTAGFRVVPSALADAQGTVSVLDGRTLQLKEFGGGVPVRVQAENIANGGVDIGVFGYTSFRVLREGGVKTLTVADEEPAGLMLALDEPPADEEPAAKTTSKTSK